MEYVFLFFTGNNKVVYKAIVVDKYINKNTDGDSYIFSLLSQQSLSQRTLRHSCNFLYLLKSDYYGTITGGADFRPTIAIVATTPMSELSAVYKYLSMEELSDGIHSFEFMGTGDPVTGLGLGGMDSSSFRLLSFKIEEKTFIPQCSTDVAYDKDYTGTESVSDWEIFEAVTQNGTATIGKKNSSTTDNRWQFSVSHTANDEQAETMAVVYATMATEPGYDYVLSFEGVDIYRNNTLQNEQRPMAGDTNFNYICLVGNSLMDMVMSQQFLSQSFLGSAVNGHTVQFTAQGSSVVIALMCQYRNVDVYGDSHATLELSGIQLTGYEGSTVTRVADGDKYRFSFNGQEKQEELGTSFTSAKFWMYDGRIGKRWNVDPVTKSWQSQYVTFSNNPILKIDPDGDDDYYDMKGKYIGNDGAKTNNIRLITRNTWSHITGQSQNVHNTADQHKIIVANQLQGAGVLVKIENSSDKYKQLWQKSNAGSNSPVEQVGYVILDVKNATLSLELIETTNATSNEADDPYGAGNSFNEDPSKIVIANIHTHPTDNRNIGKLGRNYKGEEQIINDQSQFENQYATGGDGQTATTRGARYTVGNQNVDYYSPEGRGASRNNLFSRKSIENGTKDIKRHALEQYGGKK